jgi:hypothetical protein
MAKYKVAWLQGEDVGNEVMVGAGKILCGVRPDLANEIAGIPGE